MSARRRAARPPAAAAALSLLAIGPVAKAAAAQAPSAAVPPVFAVRSESVEVDVLVTRRGEALHGLAAGDFEVRDKGRLQSVELVSAGGHAVHAVLLLDRSRSMAGAKLEQVKNAARGFLRALTARDRATVLAFHHDLELVAGPAALPDAARPGIDGLRASGATALHDALYAALKLADPLPGRPIVLVFSDGVDSLSWFGAERLLEAARGEPAAVYAVMADDELSLPERIRRAKADDPIGPSVFLKNTPTGLRRLRPRGPTFLEDLAHETGGRVWRSEFGPGLERAFVEALADARSRYVLRFEPGDTSPGWHSLEVRVKRGGAKVRARRGYTRPAAARVP